jgi:hypothetical protein
MKPLLMSLFVVLGFFTSQAQIKTFKVLVQNGESDVQISQIKTPLEKGMVLSGDFTLNIAEGSYLGLVHNSGNILEVKEAGSYSAEELFSQISLENTNTIVTRYTDFILNREKTELENGMMDEITRSFEPFSAKEVSLFIPNATELYGDKLAVEWENPSDFTIIRVMNMWEDVLMEERVHGKRHIVDLKGEKVANEDILMVKVYQQNDVESKAVAIKRIGLEEKKLHAANIESITSNISNNALLELIKAAYFEDNKLLADAFTSYVNAMLLEPDVQDYRDAYNEFLVRHKLLKLMQ